jgi:hypothetical protein
MQPLKVFFNPSSGVNEGRGAELIGQRLDRTAGEQEVMVLVAEIVSLPPAIVGLLIQRIA